MKWSPLSLAFVVVLLVGGGVLAGRAWFPRIVVQPITREVATLVPGKTIVVHDKVPGPITFVDRTVTRTVDHIVFVSTPTTLTPEQLAEAERVALRKFTLDLRIPAGQLIPCAHPHLAQSGMSCAEDVAFQARILEPAAGIFVPDRAGVDRGPGAGDRGGQARGHGHTQPTEQSGDLAREPRDLAVCDPVRPARLPQPGVLGRHLRDPGGVSLPGPDPRSGRHGPLGHRAVDPATPTRMR